MPDPIPDAAVEAAVKAIRDSLQFPDSAPPDAWPRIANVALTAAAPIIAAQATADLRAGIETLRDEWRAGRCACLTCTETRRHADALDALLRGA